MEGRAWITLDPDVLGLWDGELRTPKAAIGIEVQAAFIHCAKAFRRGQVWDVESWQSFTDVPDGCDLLVSNIGLEQSAQELRASLQSGYEQQLAEDRPL